MLMLLGLEQMATRKKKAEGPKLNTYRAGPERAGLLRPVRRPLRRRDADAADPGAGAGLRGRQGRSRLPARARRASTRTTPAGRARSISPSAYDIFASIPQGGAKIYFKRDELNHTGSHKINNCLGQILLAKRMGKTRIIAETGAGQHGVAVATVCAKLRPAVRDLHGRGRRRAPEAQRVPHEAAGRQGQRRHLRRADAEGRHERGAARLGRQRARHLLHHRHGGGPASLSGHGARLPVA